MSGEPRSRRGVLAELLRWSAGLAGVTSLPLAGCAPSLASQGGRRGLLVAALGHVPPGAALRATVRNQPLIVVNVDGRIRAFSGLCTHEACELGWNADQHLIRCPCHGSAFDPDGQVRKGPASTPLPEYPAYVEDGSIFVEGPPS